MKKTLLVLAVLFTAISSSFAGSIYLSASGFYASGPAETGDYGDTYVNNYYNHVYVTGDVSGETGSDAFCYVDVVYNTGSNMGNYSHRYGHTPPYTVSTSTINEDLGTVIQYSYLGVNLEVYSLNGWVSVNY